MADDIDIRIFAGANEPRRHLLADSVIGGMDRTDHDVELLEHRIVVVERAVGADVDFAAAERLIL